MTTTTGLNYMKFSARTGTQPPDVPPAPASTSAALRGAVDAYRTARAAWLDAEAGHARATDDEAARAARDADADAERQRAAAGDYSDPTDTATTRLAADQRAAVRRVTAGQDRLAEALHHLESACAGTDVAAPVAEAVRTKAARLTAQLSSLADELDPPWSRTTTPPPSSLRGVNGCRTCRARRAPLAPSPSHWPHWRTPSSDTASPRLGVPRRSTTASTRPAVPAAVPVRMAWRGTHRPGRGRGRRRRARTAVPAADVRRRHGQRADVTPVPHPARSKVAGNVERRTTGTDDGQRHRGTTVPGRNTPGGESPTTSLP